jgi:hypothetical protein
VRRKWRLCGADHCCSGSEVGLAPAVVEEVEVVLPVEGGDVVLADAFVIGDESFETDGVVECGLWSVGRERGFTEKLVDARGADG